MRLIEQLLPRDVAVSEAFTDVPDELTFAGEEGLVSGAIESRRREFVTARRCARAALAELGFAPAVIGVGPRREPLWPFGATGAITHCTGYRAAAVARSSDIAAIGIDAEPNEPLSSGVLDAIATSGELTMLSELTSADASVCWGRMLFSAKESVYKAWYPLTHRWLGFEDAVLNVDPVTNTFRAQLLTDGERIDGRPPLTDFIGRFLVHRGLVVTAVTTIRAPAG